MSMFSPKPRLTSSEVISSQSFFINVVKMFIPKLFNLRKLENDLYFKLLSSNRSVNLIYIFKRKSLKALLRSNTSEAFNSSIVIIVTSLMTLFYNLNPILGSLPMMVWYPPIFFLNFFFFKKNHSMKDNFLCFLYLNFHENQI